MLRHFATRPRGRILLAHSRAGLLRSSRALVPLLLVLSLFVGSIAAPASAATIDIRVLPQLQKEAAANLLKTLRVIERAAHSSRTTHATQAAVDGCRYLAALLVGALRGEPKESLLAPRYCPIAGYWDAHPLHPAIDAVAAGSFKEKQPPAIRGTGYVVASLEAALWAFFHSDNFHDGCLLAVNLGDDADTTGAVYGQLAGAFYGEPGIPPPWLERLAQRQLIGQLADQLAHRID